MLIPERFPRILRSGRGQATIFSGCLIAASCALIPLAIAADNPGAHEHGRAQLQIALEKDQIDLIFTSPAYNLAGFEHEARNENERNWLTEISHWLEQTPLVSPESGACRVTAASVQLGGKTAYHDDDDHHHHDHGHDHDHESTHRDYEVTQQLSCSETDSGDAFTSPLPGRFPELETLTVEWVGPSGQGSAVMTSSDESFNLSK